MDYAELLSLQRRVKESPAFARLETEAITQVSLDYPHVDTTRKRVWYPVGWDLAEIHAGNPYCLKAFEESFLDTDPSKNRHMMVRIVPDSGVVIIFQPALIFNESNIWHVPDPMPIGGNRR